MLSTVDELIGVQLVPNEVPQVTNKTSERTLTKFYRKKIRRYTIIGKKLRCKNFARAQNKKCTTGWTNFYQNLQK